MFQKPADDASDLYVFADLRDSWSKAADATYDQINLDSCPGSPVQCFNNTFFRQGVHFCDDSPIVMLLMGFDFFLYQLQQVILQMFRSDR